MTNDLHAIARSKKGFSLIELLVVLAILSIVATLSAPALMSMAPNMALKSAGRDLYAFLQNARVTAVRENRDVEVRFDTPGFYYRDDDGNVNWTDVNGNGIFDVGDEPRVILGEDLNGNGTLEDPPEDLDGNGRLDDNYGVAFGNSDPPAGTPFGAQAASVSFNSQGIPTAAATIYLDKSNSVRVDPNGIDDDGDGAVDEPGDNSYNTDCYAVEVKAAGSLQLHRFNGAAWD